MYCVKVTYENDKIGYVKTFLEDKIPFNTFVEEESMKMNYPTYFNKCLGKIINLNKGFPKYEVVEC